MKENIHEKEFRRFCFFVSIDYDQMNWLDGTVPIKMNPEMLNSEV